ncbi:hypothetical protein [Mycobacterium sp. E802]|uniref:hypothetical protein n=1 Tax=Mycobacterium sp. E802 TaxID=1834152 RepID=UPI001E64604C|nr:hypothetical protein [Mycobacterium sp. E802]
MTVGPGICERCRMMVRTQRSPVGSVLLCNTGRDGAGAGTAPDSVSRTSFRWVRAASIARQGSRAAGIRGTDTGTTGSARPNSHAASAEARVPSARACEICNTATVPVAAPGIARTRGNMCRRQAATVTSS